MDWPNIFDIWNFMKHIHLLYHYICLFFTYPLKYFISKWNLKLKLIFIYLLEYVPYFWNNYKFYVYKNDYLIDYKPPHGLPIFKPIFHINKSNENYNVN